jgi:hypothetical protein
MDKIFYHKASEDSKKFQPANKSHEQSPSFVLSSYEVNFLTFFTAKERPRKVTQRKRKGFSLRYLCERPRKVTLRVFAV